MEVFMWDFSVQAVGAKVRASLAYRFNLREDQHSFDAIDQDVRNGIEIKGTNLWVLMLAIFIASIGLNVNSTAVIIGAMLISPLMGPIMGLGYGASINDYPLIKKAMGNLLISILIALFTSTLYFLISPLSTAQSELLARTTPSIWDVLIALFGGLAGIIALTRKEKSNVIPGVAIATALMPPLCTAGYGLANGSMAMFFGAFYLFFINTVFIAFASFLVVGYINPPHKRLISDELERKFKRYIYAFVFLTMMPSIYLAYGMVTAELFNSRANAFLKQEMVFESSYIAKQQLLPNTRTIEVTLIGSKIDEGRVTGIARKLENYGLAAAKLVVHQTGIKELDEAALKKTLLADVVTNNQHTFDANNNRLQALQAEVSLLKTEKVQLAEKAMDEDKLLAELFAQYPEIVGVAFAKAIQHEIDPTNRAEVLLIHLTVKKPFARSEQNRIISWLKVRMGVDQVRLSFGKA